MALFSLKKRRTESFLIIHTEGFLNLFNAQWWLNRLVYSLVMLFQTLNAVMAYRAAFVMAAGIGLGLGMSVSYYSVPIEIRALQPISADQTVPIITVEKIRLPGKRISTPVIWDEKSAGLEQRGIIEISMEGDHPMAGDVRQLAVGERIDIIGSNNGVYAYRVVEIRTEDSSALAAGFNLNTETLILHTPKEWWSDQETVIIARPAN